MTSVSATLRARGRQVLEAAWREPGICVPNPATYPWQWLWDSCFHALSWAELGEHERALLELRNVLAHQADDGFVPHLIYHGASEVHAAFWGRGGTSSITQPPMYAHALAELARRGVELPTDLVEQSARALQHLLEVRPRHHSGLVKVLHPWETGCDDSPRWDVWGAADREIWRERKGALVASLVYNDGTGSPRANPAFEVGSVAFSALCAHAALEQASLTGDSQWQRHADELINALDARWDLQQVTWTDAAPDGPLSVRTLEALLPLLVTRRADAVEPVAAALLDDAEYGGMCGPAGVHRDEPAFDPDRYWRGGAWPQLTYLLWVAANRQENEVLAAALAACLRRGADRSGFAEHWHPDTGAAGGAVPQSWTALALVVG